MKPNILSMCAFSLMRLSGEGSPERLSSVGQRFALLWPLRSLFARRAKLAPRFQTGWGRGGQAVFMITLHEFCSRNILMFDIRKIYISNIKYQNIAVKNRCEIAEKSQVVGTGDLRPHINCSQNRLCQSGPIQNRHT